jgi:hypothetical protein
VPVRKILTLVALVGGLSVVTGAQAGAPLTIVEDSLPPLSAGVEFHLILHATGGAPPYIWTAVDGKLPDGLSLGNDGLLAGRPEKAGSLTLAVRVADSSHPASVVEKTFTATVSASLLLDWLDSPKVHDNRIDGSVKVSNGSHDTFDLTVVVVAVASDNGRATAIGYQHFALKPGATDIPITFGNTLPYGAYVVHADAIAEIYAKNNILRQRLQTPQALQILAGP